MFLVPFDGLTLALLQYQTFPSLTYVRIYISFICAVLAVSA